MNHEPIPVSDRVLKRIEGGALHMRSGSYFVLQIAATALAALAVFLLSAAVASFIFFSLEEGGEEFLLGFGLRGILTFLALFPWIPLAIDVAAIIALRFLLGGLKPVYRLPFPLVVGGLLGASVLTALLINLTPLHAMLKEQADADDLPILGPLYESISIPDEASGEFRGTIQSIDDRTITITHDDGDADVDDGTRVITLPEHTEPGAFEVGDEVYVAGDDDDGDDIIEAYGARELTDWREREEEEHEGSADEEDGEDEEDD